MSTEQTTGGFVTDPAEAFNPPAASGCCGSAITTSDSSGCCGSTTSADTGGCCGSTEATTTEGCCG
jgi:hypothetical protein